MIICVDLTLNFLVDILSWRLSLGLDPISFTCFDFTVVVVVLLVLGEWIFLDVTFPDSDVLHVIDNSELLDWVTKILDDLAFFFIENCKDEVHARQERDLHSLLYQTLFTLV